MLKRISTILPDLSFEEALEITKIYSISGNIKENSLMMQRPFRNPHHTVSISSLIGGGKNPKPGEISLAHNGVLFLDELPEFSRKSIEVLRGPLEDKKVYISRLQSNVMYPCNFMLVASMNPCPCGYYGSSERKCTCSEYTRKIYRNKVSGPILDRIDIQVEVSNIKNNVLENAKEESSEEIRKRVNQARNIQIKRYKDYNIFSNSELTPNLIDKFCTLTNKTDITLNKAIEKMKLTGRGLNRVLKVSRTIADLDCSKNIKEKHILEALQYRSFDK